MTTLEKNWLGLCKALHGDHQKLWQLYHSAQKCHFDLSFCHEASEGELSSILHLEPEQASRIAGIWSEPSFQQLIDKISHYQYNYKLRLLFPFSPHYPGSLCQDYTSAEPFYLFAMGNVDLLAAKGIGIVGSRHCTAYGEEKAWTVAKEFSEQELTIVSGFANGIDKAAHLGALDNDGQTILVLPHEIFQRRDYSCIGTRDDFNRSLIISPFFPMVPWQKSYTYNRNALICAFSESLVVIEAEKKSGTMNTALQALKLGIPLYVLNTGFQGQLPEGNDILLSQYYATPLSVEEIIDDDSYSRIDHFPFLTERHSENMLTMALLKGLL